MARVRVRIKVAPRHRRIADAVGLIGRRNQQPEVTARRIAFLVQVVRLLWALHWPVHEHRIQSKPVSGRRHYFLTGEMRWDIRGAEQRHFQRRGNPLVGKIAARDADNLLPVSALVAEARKGRGENALPGCRAHRRQPPANGPKLLVGERALVNRKLDRGAIDAHGGGTDCPVISAEPANVFPCFKRLVAALPETRVVKSRGRQS